MKIRRLYESKLDWSTNKIVNFIKERDDIYAKDEYIRRRIEEYLIYNKELLPKDLQERIEEYGEDVGAENVFDVYKIQNIVDKIYISMKWDDGDESADIFLTKDQLDELVDYMNNMDIYKDAKRYNV